MKEYKEPEERRASAYQRLVGAAVLLAVAVIVVPMVLDLRRDYGPSISGSNIPEQGPEFQVREVPLAPPEGAPAPSDAGAGEGAAMPGEREGGAAPSPGSAPIPSQPPAAGAEPGPAARGSPAARERPAPAAPRAAKPAPPHAIPAWVVQVGSFSTEDNARALRDRLRAKGYAAFVDRSGDVVRVRVGPEMDRSRAERLRERLARELQLQGIVVSYD